MVMEMLVAPEITWLLVSTSPEDVRTMPVPAASERNGPPSRPKELMTVSMSTTAGSTRLAMAWRSSWPWGTDSPGTGLRGPSVEVGELVVLVRVRSQPIPKPAARRSRPATTAATMTLPRRGRGGSAGGAATGGHPPGCLHGPCSAVVAQADGEHVGSPG